ncbi:MAG TPA: CDP-alcohol phosphatidyltransferase family protein, partial [Chloroflexota bacterium]
MKEVKQRSRALAVAPALFLGRLGLTPNALTVIGAVLTASVGILIAQGWFVAAGLCLWLFSATDTLDGALA